MSRRLQATLLLFVFLALLVPRAQATIYYVDPFLGNATPVPKAQNSVTVPWKTIGTALDSASAGDTINLAAGNYAESDTIRKSVTIIGKTNGSGVPTSIVSGNGINEYVFFIKAKNVTLSHLAIEVDQVVTNYGLKGETIYPGAGGTLTSKAEYSFDGLKLYDNIIYSTGPGTLKFDSWGVYLRGTTEAIDFKRNTVALKTGKAALGRAFRLLGCQGIIGGPLASDSNSTKTLYGIQWGAPRGPITIQNNKLGADGLELYGPVVGTNNLIANNTFDPLAPTGILAGLTLKVNKTTGGSVVIRNNNFPKIQNFGLFISAFSNVTVDGNTFSPDDTTKTFAALYLNTKYEGSTGPKVADATSNYTITGNLFNGNANANGSAIVFGNHNGSPTVTPFNNVVLGGAGAAANTFDSKFANTIVFQAMDTASYRKLYGASTTLWTNSPKTRNVPTKFNLDARNNLFVLSSGGSKRPTDNLTDAELYEIEDKIQHGPDYDSLGFVTIKPDTAFVTSKSFVSYVRKTPSLQYAFNVASDGWVVKTNNTSFADTLSVTHNVTLFGTGTIFTDTLQFKSNKNLTLATDLTVNKYLRLDSGYAYVNGKEMSLASGARLVGGSQKSYVVFDPSIGGKFTNKGVNTPLPVFFPVGTTDYSLVTFADQNPTNDDFSVNVKDVASPSGFAGGSLPASVTKYVSKQWNITKAGLNTNVSNATVKFVWQKTDEVGGPFNANGTSVGHYNGTDWDLYTGTYQSNGATASVSVTGLSSFSPFIVYYSPSTPGSTYYVNAATGNDNRVNVLAKNPATPWATIGRALAASQDKDTLIVASGTYTVSDTIFHGVTILGNCGSKPVFKNPVVAANVPEQNVFTLRAPNVTINCVEIQLDLRPNVTSPTASTGLQNGVNADKPGFNNFKFTNNDVYSTASIPANPAIADLARFYTWGLKLGSQNNNGTDSVTIKGNKFAQKIPGFVPGSSKLLGRGIRLWGCRGVIGGPNKADSNYFQTEYAIQAGSCRGPVTFQNNHTVNCFYGFETGGTSTNAGLLLIKDNRFDAVNYPAINAIDSVNTLVEIKGFTSKNTSVRLEGNTFNGFTNNAIKTGRSHNVSIIKNTFNPNTTSAYNFNHIQFNTKQETTGGGQTVISDTNIVVAGNTFNAGVSGYGVGLRFANHNGNGTVVPFKKVKIGGSTPDSANTFAAGLRNFIILDTASGSTKKLPLWGPTGPNGPAGYPITDAYPTKGKFDATGNIFGLASGLKAASAMSISELYQVEDKIIHQIDFDSLGFVTVVPQRAYVTANSFLTAKSVTTPGLGRAFNAISDGYTIKTQVGSFNDPIVDTVTATLDYTNGSAVSSGRLRMGKNGITLTLLDKLTVNGILNLAGGNIDIGNNDLVPSTVVGGSANSYVIATGNGKYYGNSVVGTNIQFPVGTATSYAPVTIFEQGIPDKLGVNLFKTNNTNEFDPPLPANVNTYANLQWNITENVPGGSNANVTLGFTTSNEVGPLSSGTLLAYSDGTDWFTKVAAYNTAGGVSSAKANAYTQFGAFAVYSYIQPHGAKHFVDSVAGVDNILTNPGDSLHPWKTIHFGLKYVQRYDTLDILRGTFASGDTIRKSICIRGDARLTNAKKSGYPNGAIVLGATDSTNARNTVKDFVFYVDTADVCFENVIFKVDLLQATHGIKALGTNRHNNLKVMDCVFTVTRPTNAASRTYFNYNSYGIRLEGGGSDVFTVKGSIFASAANKQILGRAIRTIGGSGLVGGSSSADSNFFGAWTGIQSSSIHGGPLRVFRNGFILNGVFIAGPDSTRSPNRIQKNTFDANPVFGANQVVRAPVEIKANNYGAKFIVDSNTFSKFTYHGLLLGRTRKVSVTRNIFNPYDTVVKVSSVTINTKQDTRGNDLRNKPMVISEVVVQGNTFNAVGNDSVGSTGILFQDYDYRAGNNPFADITVGGASTLANTFNGNFKNFIANDTSSGSSKKDPLYPDSATTIHPANARVDVSGNKFQIGASTITPASFTSLSQYYQLEDKLQHGIDFDSAGFLSVTPGVAYLTTNSRSSAYSSISRYKSPADTLPSITRAGYVLNDGDSIKTNVVTFDGRSVVGKDLTLAAAPYHVLNTKYLGVNGPGKTLKIAGVLKTDSLLFTLGGGFIDLQDSNLVVNAGGYASAGTQTSYAKITGKGGLKAYTSGVSGNTWFPIGTVRSYAPITYKDTTGSVAESFVARVEPRTTPGSFTPPIPARDKKYVKLQWFLNPESGSTKNANLSFGWNDSDTTGDVTKNTRVGTLGNTVWFGKTASYSKAPNTVNYAAAKSFTDFKSYFVYGDTNKVVLTLDLPKDTICLGSTYAVRILATDTLYKTPKVNRFYIELSNVTGSFANATIVDSVDSQAGLTRNVLFPTTLTPGNGYKIRVRSNNPKDTGLYPGKLVLGTKPAKPIAFIKGGTLNDSVASDCDSVVLYPLTPIGANRVWKNGNTVVSATRGDSLVVKASGNYFVYDANPTGCASDTSRHITVKIGGKLPTPTLSASLNTVCLGNTITLKTPSSVGYTYVFRDSTNGADSVKTVDSLNFTPLAAGKYSFKLIVKKSTGCLSDSSLAVRILVTPAPVAPAPTASRANICNGGSDTIRARGFVKYKFSNQTVFSSVDSIVVSPTVTTSYTYLGIDAGGCTSTVSLPVTVNVTPSAPATTPTATKANICAGSLDTIKAGPGYVKYKFSTQTTWSTVDTIVVRPTATTSYTYEAIDAGGCTTAVSLPVTVTISPAATPTAPTAFKSTFCGSGATAIHGSGFVKYLFNTGATPGTWQTVDSIQTGNLTATTTYTYQGIDAGGCTSAVSAPVTVTINAIPTAAAPTASPLSICVGSTSTITATGFVSYLFAPGGSWQPAGTFTFTPTAAGTFDFTYQGVDANGCTSAVSPKVTVTVTPSLAAPNAPTASPATICAGSSSTLTATTGFDKYLFQAVGGPVGVWQTANTFVVNPASNTDYTLTVIQGTCTSLVSLPTTVTVTPLPVAPTVTPAGPVSIPAGGSVSLTASSTTAGATYLWSNGATTATVSITAAGSYTVQAIANGCTSVASTPVVVTIAGALGQPTINPQGDVCIGSVVTLSINNPVAGVTYNWSYGFTGSSITVPTPIARAYTFKVVASASNQSPSDSNAAGASVVTFNVLPKPATPVLTAATPACEGTLVTFSVSNPDPTVTYKFRGQTVFGTATTFTVTAGATDVKAKVIAQSNVGSCLSDSSAEAVVAVNLAPVTGTIANNPNTIVCPGATVTLTVPAVANARYQYFAGATLYKDTNANVITVSPQTTTDYTYKVVSAAGCTSLTASASVTVTVSPAPVPTFKGANSSCSNLPVTLTADSAGYKYSWKDATGAPKGTNRTYSATVSGSYTLTVTNAAGCSATSAPFAVSINPSPDVTLNTTDTLIGPGETTTISATVNNAPAGSPYTYSWKSKKNSTFGGTSSSVSITNDVTKTDAFQSDTVWVDVTSAAGCKTTKWVVIRANKAAFIPSLLAPNGNDTKYEENKSLKVYGHGFKELKMVVYNRYGVKVYESSDVNEITKNGWNGTADGKELPADTYFYNITGTYHDGTEVKNKDGNNAGSVYLLK